MRALITGITGQDGSYLVDSLLGDATKARRVLGWKPEISFNSLIADMVEGYKCY